jgi:hypothetical protein
MGKPNPQVGIVFVLLVALCGAARAQAVVEHGAVAGASGAAAAGSRKTGKQVRSVWNALDKTLPPPPNQVGSPAVSSRRKAPRQPASSKTDSNSEVPAPAAIHEDPSGLQPGVAYEEVVQRCGAPSFEVATGPATKTLAYAGKNGGIDVELQDGKVIRIAPAK